MKFFTIDWWMGDQLAQTIDPCTLYNVHFKLIEDKLSNSVIDFDKCNFHDSNVLEYSYSFNESLLSITVYNRYAESNRIKILSFYGVKNLSFKSDPEKGLGGPVGFGDWGYSEIDYENGDYVVSVLFSSGIEMCIKFCGDVKVKNSDQQGDELVSKITNRH